jgi:hypothetical protein
MATTINTQDAIIGVAAGAALGGLAGHFFGKRTMLGAILGGLAGGVYGGTRPVAAVVAAPTTPAIPAAPGP